jgi:hypothetical protein
MGLFVNPLFLNAKPLVTDYKVFLVFLCVDELFALALTAVGVDALVGFLVEYSVDNSSHSFYLLLFSFFVSLL